MKVYIEGETYPVKDQLKAAGCRWDKDRRQWYAETEEITEAARKIVPATPIYNSPPPQDLGTTGPVELAAKFGRIALAGATVKSFTGYGKVPSPVGTVVHFSKSGVRYVKVANARPRYFSRDMLEDFDMFNTKPGYQYQWDGVSVEPTAEELAADKSQADATAAKEDAPKAWNAVVAKIDQVVTARPAWVSEATLVAKWGKPAMVHTGSYPVIHLSDSEIYYHVPGYFACDWDYPAIHRTAPLTAELGAEIMSAIEVCRQHGFLGAAK